MLVDLTDEEMQGIQEAAAGRGNSPLQSLADRVANYRKYSNVGHYAELSSIEQFTNPGLGVKIWVAIRRKLLPEDALAASRCAEQIMEGLQRNTAENDPELQKEHVRLLEEYASLFKQRPIFIKEIPNKYWNNWYGVHRPWAIITTSSGHFEVGWRKRVLSIDWSQTLIEETAEAMFPDEPVTKDGRLIHAHTVEDARRYITRIMEQAF